MRCDIMGPTGTTLLILSAACLPLTPLGAQAAAPAPASPQAAPAPFVKAEAEAVVKELATQLEDNFVFPEVAKKYGATLRANLAAGKYADFADARAFADAVTNDLQSVHKDRHLRLLAPRPGEQGRQIRRGLPPGLKAISKSGWLAEGVAYIRFELFPGDEQTLAELRKFIDDHKDAKTLIIDARTHRGGGLDEMDVLFPQLFAKPAMLVGMDTRIAVEQRRGSPVEGQASLKKVTGPEGVVRREHWVTPAAQPTALSKADVYLLTSKRTGSAGEHLSLSLKRTKRATLIGESTAGAGHYGGVIPLGHGYAAFIPVGRTFDPDTNQGWEGTGVKPDVEVPADKALDEALKRAGVSATADVALANLR